MLSAEALEFHSTHPLWARGQESVRRAMKAFNNKDGVFQQSHRVDNLGRRWIVEMQPYNGLLGMIRLQSDSYRPLECAVVTGINYQFDYEDIESGVKLKGEEASQKVEVILKFLIENSHVVDIV